MADINNFNGTGRLTRDAELKYTSTGTPLALFSIATNHRKRKGEDSERASFFDCTLWGVVAEKLHVYLSKGKEVAISGELVQDRFQDKDGNKRSMVKINVQNVKLLGGNR